MPDNTSVTFSLKRMSRGRGSLRRWHRSSRTACARSSPPRPEVWPPPRVLLHGQRCRGVGRRARADRLEEPQVLRPGEPAQPGDLRRRRRTRAVPTAGSRSRSTARVSPRLLAVRSRSVASAQRRGGASQRRGHRDRGDHSEEAVRDRVNAADITVTAGVGTDIRESNETPERVFTYTSAVIPGAPAIYSDRAVRGPRQGRGAGHHLRRQLLPGRPSSSATRTHRSCPCQRTTHRLSLLLTPKHSRGAGIDGEGVRRRHGHDECTGEPP